MVPVACVAIEYARRLVEKNLRLPTKKEVRTMVQDKHPDETKKMDGPKWTDIWTEAGLESLPRKSNW